MTMGSKCTVMFVIVLTLPLCAAKQDRTCSEGMYQVHFEGDISCFPCPVRTFLNLKDHSASRCFPCTEIENRTVEVFMKPCSPAQDTHIHCVDGYFRHMDISCKKCSLCPKDLPQTQQCQKHSDTVCGDKPSKCNRGEYLHPNYYDCRQCPENTFMSEDAHTHTKCSDCQYLSDADLPPNTILEQNCTSTQPAHYVCKDGFYWGLEDGVGCIPCQSCEKGKYEGRECGMYQDRVCCDKPKMAVVDTPHNERCIDEIDDAPNLYPHARTVWVRKNGCTSVMCYIALEKTKAKPRLTWNGPNVNKHQQFPFESGNNLSDVIVYQNTLTLCKFSSADEGEYRCKDSLMEIRIEIHLDIKLACEYGTYNPPACDENCSQHCRVEATSDQSPCHQRNGTCLFGCVNGYKGPMCKTQRDGTRKDAIAVVSVLLVLVLIVVIIYCVKRSGKLKCAINGKCLGKRTEGDPEQQEALMGDVGMSNTNIISTSEASIQTESNNLFTSEGNYLASVERPTATMETTQPCEKSLSLDQVKEKLQEAVKELQQTETFHSEEAIRCLDYIFQTFYDCHCSRSGIGDFLAELRFPVTCMDILKGYLSVRKNLQNDKIWSVINRTYQMCRNFTGSSRMFAKKLLEFGAVQSMTEVLRQETYLDNVDKERECDVVKAGIFGLRHIATRVGKVREFQDSNTVEVLKSLSSWQNASIRAFAMITLTSILEEDMSKLTDTTDTIKTIVKWIQEALHNSEDGKYEGFTPRALLASLAKLAENDDNKRKIVEAGALSVFLTTLQQTDCSGQSWTAICLRELARDKDLRQTISYFTGLVQALEDLKDRENSYLKGNVDSALKAILHGQT